MAGFGENLRRERQMRNISLEEISAVTKIGTRLLRALEEEQFDQLPGGIFNKGYVRAYARHVGIDEDQAVVAYMDAAGQKGLDVGVVAEQRRGRPAKVVQDNFRMTGTRGFPLVGILTFALVLAGIAGGWRMYRQRLHNRTVHDASLSQQIVPLSGTALGSTGSAKAPIPSQSNPAGTHESAHLLQPAGSPLPVDPVAKDGQPPPRASGAMNTNDIHQRAVQDNTNAGDTQRFSGITSSASNDLAESDATPLEIVVRTKDRAWISIKSDGHLMVRGAIGPADIKTVRANNEIVFWTGNAGVVELSLNGKNVPLKSGENSEQVLVFTSRSLQARAAMQ